MHRPVNPRRHRPLAITAALATVLALAACSTSEEPAPDGEPAELTCSSSGAASDAVTVSAEPGTAPDATFEGPLSTDDTVRTVVTPGKGEPAAAGDLVTVSYTAYNGTTGEEVDSTGHGEGADRIPFQLDPQVFLPGVVEALMCSTLGERVVAVIPPVDAFGEGGNEQFSLGADDMLVFVMDVVEPYDATADMVIAEPADPDLPAVTFAADGTPSVTFPQTTPPTVPTLQILAEGTGQTVEEGDTVEVNYHGVNWNSGVTFDSSWERGAPATFSTGQVIAGFGAAMVGQPVGSQVVVVVPSPYGYGNQGSGEDIAGGDTIVFVIDILGAESAAG